MLTIGDQFHPFQAKAVIGRDRGEEFTELTEHRFEAQPLTAA